ncbi:glycoside hydrolase family 16 protein [Sphingobacterium mizutaii]|uniref:glycoside hydrolase family 16 protein n=1 Tax=Sphingobacterium mizutaii TaxID=1010 RepID=UPI003D98A37D
MEKNNKKWKLVWQDEFNYEGLPDSTKWSFDTKGNAYNWGNNEAQHYTAHDTSNAYVKKGYLTITAKRQDAGGKKYTSARLRTIHKGDWNYGRFEIRAKVPTGRGTWPAIWMMPSADTYGGWPKSGEIDIMEYIGSHPDSVLGTVHTESYNHVIGTQKGKSTYLPDAHKKFHTYVLEWDANEIKIYADKKLYFTFKNEGKTAAEWPFDQKFHLLLNLAIGGGLGGQKGIDDSLFPQSYVIDYVRVYQR